MSIFYRSNATDDQGRDFDDPEYGNYGIQPGRGSGTGRSPTKFLKALQAATTYKQKARDKAEIEDAVKNKDNKGTKGFKISDDATVIEGYRDPGYTIQGQQGRSLFGPIGAAVGIFNPGLGAGIRAVGSLTGY